MTKQVFDPKKPVTTRDGKPVRILTTSLRGNQVVGIIGEGSDEYVGVRQLNGKLIACNGEHNQDFVNVPVRTSRFANIYDNQMSVTLYKTRRAADDVAYAIPKRREAVIEYLYEDGKFVNVRVAEIFE